MRAALLAIGLVLPAGAAPRVLSVDGGLVTLELQREEPTTPDIVVQRGRLTGAAELEPVPAAPRTTELLLHAPPGDDTRGLREIARAWSDRLPADARVEVPGLVEPVRGPEALRQGLAASFETPLPDLEVGAALSARGGPGIRRILVATELAPLIDWAAPTDGTRVHVVHLRRPDLQPPPPPSGLRAALRSTGGLLLVVDDVESGQARVARLREQEPELVRARVPLCSTGEEPVSVSIDGAPPLVVPGPVPGCAPPAASSSPSLPPWLLPAVLGTGVILIGGALLLRRRRPGSPPVEPEPAPGRLLTPVDDQAERVLIIRRGAGLVGQAVPMPSGRLTLGAAPGNDALIDLPGVSGRHARFECFPGGVVFVMDADSANGTWVGGRRLERGERVQIKLGERVVIGSSLELELARGPGAGA